MRYILIIAILVSFLSGQSSWQNYLQRAQYYEKTQQPEEAILNYELAWKGCPNKENVYPLYFNFVSKNGIWEKAEEISAIVLKLKPKNIRYLNDYARSIAFQGRKEAADSLWKNQLTRNDIKIADIQSMANAMLQSRMFDDGIELLEYGYKKFPTQYSILLQIASLYQSRLSYQKAASYYLRYLAKNPGQYNLIQSRILNMLDNWQDGKILADYIQETSAGTQGELVSSIYLKFKQYDKAYPILVQNYDSKTGQKYHRYVQYARIAQVEGNAQFALDLLTFLSNESEDATKSNDLLLTKYEIKYNMIPKNAAVDSVNRYIENLDKFFKYLSPQQQIRSLKLYVNSYHYLLNDLDNAFIKASMGAKNAVAVNDKDYFLIELIKISFEKGDYKKIVNWRTQIRSLDILGEAYFYQILAIFEEKGLESVPKETNQFIRKFKPSHIFYQKVLDIQVILTLANKDEKNDLIKGIVLFYQKKYGLVEKRYTEFIDNENRSVTLNHLVLNYLYDMQPFIGASGYLENAYQVIERFPGHPENAKLLWRIALIDPPNEEKYYEEILDKYPESLEADKVRNKKKKMKARLG